MPWIVPRLTRCDSTYGDIEGFYDTWVMRAGAAVIDSLPLSIPGERIEPLPRPASVVSRDLRRRMLILSDGSVPVSERDLHGNEVVGSAAKEPVSRLWRALSQRRRELTTERGLDRMGLMMGS